MFRVIDAHGFRNAGFVLVAGLDLVTFFQFAQWQTIWRVAINLVGRTENEWRFWTKSPGDLQQIHCAVGTEREIGLRIARRPIVRRLRCGVPNRADRSVMLLE